MGGIKMDYEKRRVTTTVIVGIAIYFVSDFIIGFNGHDEYLQAIKVLTSVIGAGCYWVGSNEW